MKTLDISTTIVDNTNDWSDLQLGEKTEWTLEESKYLVESALEIEWSKHISLIDYPKNINEIPDIGSLWHDFKRYLLMSDIKALAMIAEAAKSFNDEKDSHEWNYEWMSDVEIIEKITYTSLIKDEEEMLQYYIGQNAGEYWNEYLHNYVNSFIKVANIEVDNFTLIKELFSKEDLLNPSVLEKYWIDNSTFPNLGKFKSIINTLLEDKYSPINNRKRLIEDWKLFIDTTDEQQIIAESVKEYLFWYSELNQPENYTELDEASGFIDWDWTLLIDWKFNLDRFIETKEIIESKGLIFKVWTGGPDLEKITNILRWNNIMHIAVVKKQDYYWKIIPIAVDDEKWEELSKRYWMQISDAITVVNK